MIDLAGSPSGPVARRAARPGRTVERDFDAARAERARIRQDTNTVRLRARRRTGRASQGSWHWGRRRAAEALA